MKEQKKKFRNHSQGEAVTHSKEKRDKFIEMRAEGRTLANIAKELKIAHNTATSWNSELMEEIAAAKAFNVEEMIEKYRMTKEKRIEMYGERLLVLQDELAKRDLSQIPTNKLFDMTMKCSRALQQEIEMPQFLTEEDIKAQKFIREAQKKNQEEKERMDRMMLGL
jgi:hypothetical protein